MTARTEWREIRSLTGLRGVAALYVAFYHLGAIDLASGHGRIFARHGYLAVDLFFTLSGFVIAMVYGGMFTETIRWRDCRTFMVRRIARVYPLYFVLLPIGFAQQLASFMVRYKGAVWIVCLAQFFLVQAWGLSISIIDSAWSISTELAAYLLFPLIYLATAGSRTSGLAVAFAVVFALLLMLTVRAAAVSVDNNGPLDLWCGESIMPLFRCLLEFTVGMLTWQVAERPAAQRFFRREWLSLLIFAMIVTLLCFDGSDGSVVLCIPLLLLSLYDDRSRLARFLGLPALHRLGELSYAIYLLHYLFRLPAWHDAPAQQGWPIIGIKISTILIFAWLAHDFIEQPGRHLVRRLLEPRRSAAPEANPNLTPP